MAANTSFAKLSTVGRRFVLQCVSAAYLGCWWPQYVRQYPANGPSDMVFGAISHHHQINIFAVTGRRRKMNLVEERAATHGDLGAQEIIIEKCRHRPAKQKWACLEKTDTEIV